MPFDNAKFNAKADIGDVAGAFLDLSVTIDDIVGALENVEAQTGCDISADLDKLRKRSTESFDRFVVMTGWRAADEAKDGD